MNNNRILVTGSTGMVGSRFVELHPINDGWSPRSYELDITNSEQIHGFIEKNQIGTVINFAAFTDIGSAEKERGDTQGECWGINVLGTENLANSINPDKTFFIHISTDMVFSGSPQNPGPYKEDQLPEEDPQKVTWYGYTKGQAEQVVKNVLGDRAAIVRIIYPVRARYERKLDYIRKLISLKNENKLYPMFGDQQVSITYIDELALALNKLIASRAGGVYHISTPDMVTPYELANYFFSRYLPEEQVQVQKASVVEFLQKRPDARYPVISGLDPTETMNKLGMNFRNWKQVVDALIEQGISI